MRIFFSLAFIVGGMIYVVSGLAASDLGQIGLALLAILLGIGGLYTAYQKAQVQQGQRDFWLRQRRR